MDDGVKNSPLTGAPRTPTERPAESVPVPAPAVLPDYNGRSVYCPELLTEEELIIYLRIPQVSQAKDYHNVIENLKRVHDLPRIHLCGQPLYPIDAIRQWIKDKTTRGK
jgi:hypothetical protein